MGILFFLKRTIAIKLEYISCFDNIVFVYMLTYDSVRFIYGHSDFSAFFYIMNSCLLIIVVYSDRRIVI